MQHLKKLEIRNSLNILSFEKTISMPTLIQALRTQNHIFAVEIEKQPKTLLKKSVWVGNKIGGMSMWMNCIQSYLPFRKFYLIVDAQKCYDKDVLEYYDEFYSRAFYRNYLGLCAVKKKEIPSELTYPVNSIIASDFDRVFEQPKNTVLMDVRTREQAEKDPVRNLPKSITYLNVPLSHEYLGEEFQYKTKNLKDDCQIITMCARGYRGFIAYSTFRHMCRPSWRLIACKSPYVQINNSLEELKKRRAHL